MTHGGIRDSYRLKKGQAVARPRHLGDRAAAICLAVQQLAAVLARAAR